ncbi:chloramphenicol acetyltransferase [Flaviaesturariibacter aridisoli]|uniref:Chloramphenicol acetyltransferase n=1 Tax=Flaviaesturariibacter aridisoli TaxID=2545761 RepID=A0A4R4E058_9BACT|nr:chloramphenicol acetyltransferase [Flaviaesturariibacter aridisoli]TCZ72784.1 chloramphenicol acetyltransferase [Flaviaesturariibacter aridisoli]
MKRIDIESWNRKEHYEFFSSLKSPTFGITADVDCTAAYAESKARGRSFFATYLHASMRAVNSVPELRLRIIDGAVWALDVIHAGAAVSRGDGTFAFIFVPHADDFATFNASLNEELDAVRSSTGLRLNGDNVKHDLVRYSTLPWLHFSAILHPSNHNPNDAVPRITFGAFREEAGRKRMPVSVEAHHGLVDGLHVSRYFEELQRLLGES